MKGFIVDEFSENNTKLQQKKQIIQKILSNKSVGIAGAGGLGSNVAIALARSGIKKFILVDFDRIEKSNLNRQYYFISQLNQLKVEALKDNIRSVAQERSVYEHLNQEYNIAKDAYVHSRDQLQQARLAQSLSQEKQHLTIVDKPAVPTKPFKPDRLLIILLGFFAGIFLGTASALTLDHFDHSIKKVEDIERFLGAPFLGSISTRVRGDTA